MNLSNNYHIILINPPVYDFTYYNLWEKPLGLLMIAAAFEKDPRCRLTFIDCVGERLAKKSEYERGAGKLTGAPAEKPECFASIKRNYRRYGIAEGELKARLAEAGRGIKPGEPAAALISSMMTYWYRGAFEAARAAREMLPASKIAIGGIYARLMPGHASASGLFDHVETGYGAFAVRTKILELLNIPPIVASKTAGAPVPGEGRGASRAVAGGEGDMELIPAYHLQPELNNSVALLASSGCPYKCSYCASGKLYSNFIMKPAGRVVRELLYYRDALKVRNAAFYDDALLYRKEEGFYRWAREWIEAGGPAGGFSFHLPNAVHAAMIDGECSELMRGAGFKTVRLGYEFYGAESRRENSGKVSGASLKAAVANLLKAGFTRAQIGVYILFGHPGSGVEEAGRAVDFVSECGATPNISLFSPIPGTPDGEAVFKRRPEILSEPLLQNKSAYFELFSGGGYEAYYELKSRIQRGLG